jgi:FKBP-type peptidyl-prolyl cis-trans isomerase SlyD
MNVADGKVVTIEYELSADGDVVDSSGQSGPLRYVHGEGRIIPGLERALAGREEGEHVHVVIPPEDAYGFHDPERVELVPKTALDPVGEVCVGMRFESETPKGIVVATVIALEGNDARIDSNHPLADKELHFDVRVIAVREPVTDKERSAGTP